MSETKPQEQIVEITTYLAQVEMDYHDEVQAQVFGELVEAENFIKEMLEEVMEVLTKTHLYHVFFVVQHLYLLCLFLNNDLLSLF